MSDAAAPRIADNFAMPPPPTEPDRAGVRSETASDATGGDATLGDVRQPMQPLAIEHDALAALIDDHQAAVRQLVFRLLSWRDGGEDVVQEVFLQAWRSRRKLAGLANLELWLKRIAINKCRSRQRREAVRRRWLFWRQGQKNLDIAPAPDAAASQDEQAARVRQAIAALSGRYRAVIVLHYLEQLSIENIAALTGARRNTVEVQLHRARLQLEKTLADLA